jgi:hypothetical protein
MVRQFFSSIRPYLGALAFGFGCLGLLLLVFAIAVMALMGGLYPGFSADGAGREMSAADRSAAASERNLEIAQYQLAPLFVMSIGLIGYGFCEARMEQKRKHASNATKLD